MRFVVLIGGTLQMFAALFTVSTDDHGSSLHLICGLLFFIIAKLEEGPRT